MRHLLTLLVLLFSTSAFAEAPLLENSLKSLNGKWVGELQYRDYQGDGMVSLPMSRTNKVMEDGVTIFQSDQFDDGPKHLVYIYSLLMLSEKKATLTSTSFRKNDEPNISVERIVSFSGLDNDIFDEKNWILILEANGYDDDRPAILRYIVTLQGSDFKAEKLVKFKDESSLNWLMRNKTSLKHIE